MPSGGAGGSVGGSAGDTGMPSGGTGESAGDTSAPVAGASGSAGDTGGVPPLLGDSVLTHHMHPNRDGVYIQPTLTKAVVAGLKQDTAFNASLPDAGAIYAQPLFVDGSGHGPDLVIVAGESGSIYAFDAVSGARVWKTNLGTPGPLSAMSCGNLDPNGVTGTPVIDFASRTLFADAVVVPTVGAKPKHQLFALSIDTGAVRPDWSVDVAAAALGMSSTTFAPATMGQRGALSIVAGTLYVPFGGLYGDCGTYHGAVMAVSISDATQVKTWSTTLNGGGIWAPGGVSSDLKYVYVATGNTFGGAGVWGGGDALIRLGLGAAFAQPPAFFAPSNWAALDASDLDMGTAPIVFDLPGSAPSQLAIVFGKDGNAYLLDRMNPGGVGNALSPRPSSAATLKAANGAIISAPVLYTTPTATYVSVKGNVGSGCTSGTGSLTTLKVIPGSPPTLAYSWCAGNGNGSPMVTTSDGSHDAIVWLPGAEGGAHLQAFDGDSGAPIAFTGSTVNIPGMARFNTPIAAKGRIYVSATNALVAFTL